jgi:hypothetical protein
MTEKIVKLDTVTVPVTPGLGTSKSGTTWSFNSFKLIQRIQVDSTWQVNTLQAGASVVTAWWVSEYSVTVACIASGTLTAA